MEVHETVENEETLKLSTRLNRNVLYWKEGEAIRDDLQKDLWLIQK